MYQTSRYFFREANEWKEKHSDLEEVGEAPIRDDQKKPLLISILLVNIMEHLLKSATMRNDGEGSYDELEMELLEHLAMVDQQNWSRVATSTLCRSRLIT